MHVNRDKSTTAPSTAAAKIEALRVLVVDDSADSAESIALLLALEGHETRVAVSGVKALEMAQTFAPQLVLLDIWLGDIDGYEVARRLRAQPQTANAFLVALTGHGDIDAHIHAAAAGCDEYFAKPFEPDQLAALAQRAAARVRFAALFSATH
jgi:two-component system CheB/CheR fusion protein